MDEDFISTFNREQIMPVILKGRAEFERLLKNKEEQFCTELKDALGLLLSQAKNGFTKNKREEIHYIGLHYLFLPYFTKEPKQLVFRAYDNLFLEEQMTVESLLGFAWLFEPLIETEKELTALALKYQFRGASTRDVRAALTREMAYYYEVIMKPLVERALTKEYIGSALEEAEVPKALEVFYAPSITSLQEEMDIHVIYPKSKTKKLYIYGGNVKWEHALHWT